MKDIGIIYLNDKITNINNKGDKFKKFRSILNGKEYLIKTKRENMHQTYCIIDNFDNTVLEYLDDINNDYSKILQRISLLNWSMKFNKNYVFNDIDLTPIRENYLDNNIISIDPVGCNDIDDAIHVNINKEIEIFVHISDPTSYFEFNSDIDKELQNRISSIYIDKTYHMLPEILSTDVISLKKNQIKRAYTFKIKINTNNISDIHEIIKQNKDIINFDFKFIKTNIIVKDNITYEEFDSNLDNLGNLDNEYYKNLYKIGKEILDGFDIKYDIYDSHKMVEGFMILCNVCASKNCILKRANKNIDDSIVEYTLEDKKHSHINNYYTHFTSPIRRYADMLVHRILYGNNINIVELNNIIDNINQINKNYKKVYNIYNLLNLLGEKNEIEINGTIYDVESNHIKILINNRILYLDIIDRRLINNNIVNIVTYNDKINTNDKIIINYKDKEIEYRTGDKVKVKIYFIKNNINPFKIILSDNNLFIL